MRLRRRDLLPLALACAALAATYGVSPATPATSSKAATTRTTAVGVGLREYRVALYRSRVLPGRVRLNLENLGEDGHDLRVIGPSGGSGASVVRGTSPEVKPGARYTLTVTLRKRGLYRLVCTLADHEARGMVARLRVVKKL
jgi:plastocyanin